MRLLATKSLGIRFLSKLRNRIPKINRYFKIWLIKTRISVMQRMAHRLNFILLFFGVLAQMALSVAFVSVIYRFVNNVSGWQYGEILIVTATYMLIEGLMWVSCAFVSGLSQGIRHGQLDLMLTKPLDSQFIVSIYRADPEDIGRFITAVILLIFSIKKTGITLTSALLGLPGYLLFLSFSFVIAYSFILILKSFNIWLVSGGAIGMISNVFIASSQYPVDIYLHKPVKFALTYIIPIAFISTVPARIFIDGFNARLLLITLIIAAAFFLISRKFFHFALRHYSSASS